MGRINTNFKQSSSERGNPCGEEHGPSLMIEAHRRFAYAILSVVKSRSLAETRNMFVEDSGRAKRIGIPRSSKAIPRPHSYSMTSRRASAKPISIETQLRPEPLMSIVQP